jgi:hypothetical protein
MKAAALAFNDPEWKKFRFILATFPVTRCFLGSKAIRAFTPFQTFSLDSGK